MATTQKIDISVIGSTTSALVPDVQNQYMDWIGRYDIVPFGSDNNFPQALQYLNRISLVNRSILNWKTIYINGKGLVCNEDNGPLQDLLDRANNHEQTLTDVVKDTVHDEGTTGNGWVEIVTDRAGSYIHFYHKSSEISRLDKNIQNVAFKAKWQYDYSLKDAVTIPLYPVMQQMEDGQYHSMLHFKKVESGFQHYGVIDYIAGLNTNAILYKSDRWNLSCIENSFKPSGFLVAEGNLRKGEGSTSVNKMIKDNFAGENKAGTIMSIMEGMDPKSAKFIALNNPYDADWQSMYNIATTNLIMAHNWFRSLVSMPDNTGFDTNRILNEYIVALPTVIQPIQNRYLKVFKKVISELTRMECDDLAFDNKPPVREEPKYMYIHEARMQAGLPVEPEALEDKDKYRYLSELDKQINFTADNGNTAQ